MIALRLLTAADQTLVERMIFAFRDTLAPGFESVSAEPFFRGPGCVGFATDDDGALALFVPDEIDYCAHLICNWDWRGKAAVDFGRAAVGRMFTEFGAEYITAQIPRTNKPSCRVCRAIGGIPDGFSVDTLGRSCKNYLLERERWAELPAASFQVLAP